MRLGVSFPPPLELCVVGSVHGLITHIDGVINVALYHCLGPSIQTALFNGPLVVIIGWALGKPMDLNFEIFMIVLLVLSIIVVGNFLRDGESNWLEGALLVVRISHLGNARLSMLVDEMIDCIRYHRDCLVVLSQPGCSNIERLQVVGELNNDSSSALLMLWKLSSRLG
jgi:hypothetical protein